MKAKGRQLQTRLGWSRKKRSQKRTDGELRIMSMPLHRQNFSGRKGVINRVKCCEETGG